MRVYTIFNLQGLPAVGRKGTVVRCTQAGVESEAVNPLLLGRGAAVAVAHAAGCESTKMLGWTTKLMRI